MLPAPSSKNKYPGRGLVSASTYDSIFTDDEKKPAKEVKIKKPGPKQTKPGNWKESEIITGDEPSNKKSDSSSRAHSPLVNPVDPKIAAHFPTGRPMEDVPDIIHCKHCKKPFTRVVAAEHISRCLRKKQEKLQKKKEAKEAKDAAARRERGEEDDTPEAGKTNKAKKTAAGGGSVDENGNVGGAKKGKKRKAEGDVATAEKAPNAKKAKKNKDEMANNKAKTGAKPKGPVDVEKQCGVKLPNGAMCARSLTCKSHSMGAKRAVPGRSLPYDMLLQQYQKKNQAKQQRAAINANAPVTDDFEIEGPVDSEEEKEAVVAGVRSSAPRPVVGRTFVETRKKYQYVRMKEMLLNALGGSRGAGLFATAPTAQDRNHHANDMGGILGGSGPSQGMDNAPMSAGLDASHSHSRKSSMAMGGGPRTMMPGSLPPPSRKQSVSGAV